MRSGRAFAAAMSCLLAIGSAAIAVEELAGDEGEDRGRAVRNDGKLDAVEMRQALFPVVRVARQLDRFVDIEFHELEWAGADRVRTHLLTTAPLPCGSWLCENVFAAH